MSFEELGVYRLLLGTNQVQDQREFAEEVLEPILCFDRENKRETLLKTLRALVSCNFNMARTARQLDIHINTMKYRSRQLGSLLGGDINSNDRRLEFELALKILDLE